MACIRFYIVIVNRIIDFVTALTPCLSCCFFFFSIMSVVELFGKEKLLFIICGKILCLWILYTVGFMAKGVECSPMVRETWVQSYVASYQRHKRWYLIPPCLTLSSIRYVSRVKWSNPGKGVALSPTLPCSSYRKGSLWVPLDSSNQLYFYFFTYIYIYICAHARARVCVCG